MKRAVMFCAVAVAVSAFGITTTKEYVDRRDAAITNAVYALQTNFEQRVDNVYTKAETDARIPELAPATSLAPATNYTDAATNALAGQIAELIPPGMTTNDVCAIVTNEVELGYTEWELHGIPDDFGMERYGVADPVYTVSFDPLGGGVAFLRHDGESDYDVYADTHDPDATFLQFYNGTGIGGEYNITATRERLGTQNALGLARLSDIPDSVSPETVTNVVRAVAHKVSDYIYDPVDEVCWKRRMLGGYLEYVAVTNIDVTLPENYSALEALERGNE